METPGLRRRDIPFHEAESGMTVGLCHVPVSGFEWRRDVRPAIERGRLLTEDPTDPEWWLVPRGELIRRYAVLGREKLAQDFIGLRSTPRGQRSSRSPIDMAASGKSDG